MRDYYKVLGIERNISQKNLKKHYYKLAKKYHPDTYEGTKSASERKFKEITEAYNALSNSKKRKRYDMGGMRGNLVYTNGFSSKPKKEIILDKLNNRADFSIGYFANELRVSNINLQKIIEKLISNLKINAKIENEYVLF